MQAGFATPQTPQVSVAVTFGGAQAAGNFIAVLVGWSDTTAQVTSVSDTSGNTYQVAAGPTTRPGELTHVIYYAKNIAAAAAGANVVQVAFSQAAAYPDVRVLEYSGVDRAAPLDVAVGATGNSAASASGSVATTNANDLLIAGNVVMTYTSEAGSDFVARVVTTPDGDLAADRVVSATGSYGATASLTGAGAWIMQMAAFRAATISDDTQPPSAATRPRRDRRFQQPDQSRLDGGHRRRRRDGLLDRALPGRGLRQLRSGRDGIGSDVTATPGWRRQPATATGCAPATRPGTWAATRTPRPP